MGMLVEGVWRDVPRDTKSTGGAFVRPESVFRDRVTDVARVVVEFSPPIVESIRQRPELADDARAAIAAALRPLERDGTVYLQASALIVTAH